MGKLELKNEFEDLIGIWVGIFPYSVLLIVNPPMTLISELSVSELWFAGQKVVSHITFEVVLGIYIWPRGMSNIQENTEIVDTVNCISQCKICKKLIVQDMQ